MAKNYLMELLQAASNSAAGNVSGPVDLLAMGMRKLGIPVGNEPVGGSEWMRRQGLTREVQNPYINAAGETLGMVAPIGVAAKAPQIAAGLNQAVRNAQAPASPGLGQRGAIVWHGSPHKFDKFDSSKIGTGEGAQAYGHGIYLTDTPAVAKGYAENLSSAGLAKHSLAQHGGQLDDAILDAEKSINNYKALISNGGGGDVRRAGQMLSMAEKKLEDLRAIKAGALNESGSLYKADLSDGAIARMLDWDKPLSKQSPAVFEAIRKAFPPTYINGRLVDPFASGKTGQAMFDELRLIADRRGAPGMRAAEPALRSAGVPGIRYLDADSRGAGAGTSNYVVFPGEENAILKILERNGQPLP